MQTKRNNLIVGASVLLDFGHKWQGVRPEFQEQEHERTKKENAHYYGRTGVVVDYDSSEGKVLIRMDDDQTTDWHYRGAARITKLPTPNARVEELLQAILDALKK